MKIFIIGLPGSEHSKIAKALSNNINYLYFNVESWFKNDFINPLEEFISREEYNETLLDKLSLEPDYVSHNISKIINTGGSPLGDWVIDGISTPRNLIQLFDYRKDIIIFLNRIDNETDLEDFEKIGISVMRDYCFWLSSAGFLSKEKWLEYNYKIPGEDSEAIKKLGSKNTVFIVKSLDKVIAHLTNYIENDLSK
jgi:hypothetical protein